MTTLFSILGALALAVSFTGFMLATLAKEKPEAARDVLGLSAQWAIAAGIFMLVAK